MLPGYPAFGWATTQVYPARISPPRKDELTPDFLRTDIGFPLTLDFLCKKIVITSSKGIFDGSQIHGVGKYQRPEKLGKPSPVSYRRSPLQDRAWAPCFRCSLRGWLSTC